MEIIRTPPCSCLNCGKALDSASSVGDSGKPGPGDLTVCIACGHIMAFADNLTVRQLTDNEIIEAAGDPRIVAINTVRTRFKPR